MIETLTRMKSVTHGIWVGLCTCASLLVMIEQSQRLLFKAKKIENLLEDGCCTTVVYAAMT
jgi:hypothetical protein